MKILKFFWLVPILVVSVHSARADFPAKGPLVGAHQGGAIHLCANTIPRFETAARRGADILEMDLHASLDLVPFVTHDKELDHFTTCTGRIDQAMAADIYQVCRCRFGNSLMPSFEEVLIWNMARPKPLIINAEFKDLRAIVPAIELVKKYKAYDFVYFQTKSDRDRYNIARSHDAKVKLLFAPGKQESLDWALSLNDPELRVIELHENIRTSENIEKIRRAGKLSSENSWHFSATREIFMASCDEVWELGIDIAITDRVTSCVWQKPGK